MIIFDEERQQRRLQELRLKEAEGLAEIMAQKYGLPYLDLSKVSINTDALRLIPEAEARSAGVAAFRLKGKEVYLITLSPTNEEVKRVIAALEASNHKINLYLGSLASLRRAWERYREIVAMSPTHIGVITISNDTITENMKTMRHLDDVRRAINQEAEQTIKGGGISGIVEMMLAGALVTEASDLHLEPQVESIRLRYRLDGVLEDVVELDRRVYSLILSRIKLVSGLKLNVKQSAQDGRFSIKVGETEMEIRTSILPGAYGESIVLRILNPDTIRLKFETLGVEPTLLKVFDREIRKPNGIILLTGPTGSGKTTTLYSFLREINSPKTKIITIEDPIEYHLPGVNQTQVNPSKGYTFISGLRSALRQDPDVIMVGEIRDQETARIAVNSSLTGHLVFSTLHTNNAAGTIPRLIDLGINPKIMASALNIAIAQRLVRRLCDECKQTSQPTPEEARLISAIAASVVKKRPDLAPRNLQTIFRPQGCSACNNTGYRGREGLFEAILMDEAVAQTAINNPNEKEIKIAAWPQRILDMKQSGIIKVLAGATALEEVGRVVDLNEEII